MFFDECKRYSYDSCVYHFVERLSLEKREHGFEFINKFILHQYDSFQLIVDLQFQETYLNDREKAVICCVTGGYGLHCFLTKSSDFMKMTPCRTATYCLCSPVLLRIKQK